MGSIFFSGCNCRPAHKATAMSKGQTCERPKLMAACFAASFFGCKTRRRLAEPNACCRTGNPLPSPNRFNGNRRFEPPRLAHDFESFVAVNCRDYRLLCKWLTGLAYPV